MTIGAAIYQMLIGPLELLFEVIYQLSYKAFGDAGLAIIPVSLAINTICLPLYLRADSIQRETREKEESMASWVDHIKKNFSGDERYMILQTYYRVENYKPIYTLRNSFSLILQIPFFMAAYHFLSHLDLLHGVAFGPIKDLGAPDGLLLIGGISVNILPVLMTAVNLISSSIYSKTSSLRDKVQLYGLAVIFLVLLYDSPSGLVFYWLLNNLYSLGKNVVLSITGNIKPLPIKDTKPAKESGSVSEKGSRRGIKIDGISLPKTLPAHNSGRFFLGCLFLAALIGALIPSSVVSSSPTEFIILKDYRSPLFHVLNSFLISFGTFVFWFGILYTLLKEKYKSIFELIIWILSGIAIVNYFFWGTDMGTLSPVLQYKSGLYFTSEALVINTEICVILAVILLLAGLKKSELTGKIYGILVVIVVGMTIRNSIIISSKIPEMEKAIKQADSTAPSLLLSKDKKNVVVLVLDKAVSGFVPYEFNERPQLRSQFEGFTWYPNTISFGNMTNIGSPGLYGGYEYTPEEMNKRSSEWLGDKQNEALKIMPVLFEESGYEVTVCDPPYAGYQNIPDLSIYDDYPDIRTFLTGKGVIRSMSDGYNESKKAIWKRNFFCYGIMKTAPVILQQWIYQGGSYFYSNATDLMQIDLGNGRVKSVGGQEEFMNAYAVLEALPRMTRVTDEGAGTFSMLHNLTPHEPVLLQKPDYTPEMKVDNTEYDKTHKIDYTIDGRTLELEGISQITHYHSNMAALIQVGNWLDYLREQDLYDNTRIIIVADHGAPVSCLSDMRFGDGFYEDAMYYNPLLMVKDFDQNSPFRADYKFMTNADTPVIAFDSLIDDPVNPFTGNPINNHAKEEGEVHILHTDHWQVDVNNGNTFLPGEWYAVRNQNIFDMSNWVSLGKY